MPSLGAPELLFVTLFGLVFAFALGANRMLERPVHRAPMPQQRSHLVLRRAGRWSAGEIALFVAALALGMAAVYLRLR